ncbi:hypothetical protein [Lucifera butyrica]|nr:hypothetical protein [Lucifera butyrica]
MLFAEKVTVCPDELRLMAGAAKRRKEELEFTAAVEECRILIHSVMSASLQGARKKSKLFASDLLAGREGCRTESFVRRIINQAEINALLQGIAFRISTRWHISRESTDAALNCCSIDPVDFPDCSRGLIRQYISTVIVTEGIANIAKKVCDESLDQFHFNWFIQKVSKELNWGMALLRIVDCHPAAQRERCIKEIEKMLDGVIFSFYDRLARNCTRQIAEVMYSAYKPARQVKKSLYLISQAV